MTMTRRTDQRRQRASGVGARHSEEVRVRTTGGGGRGWVRRIDQGKRGSDGEVFELAAGAERGLQPARLQAAAAPGIAGARVAVLGGDLAAGPRPARYLRGTRFRSIAAGNVRDRQ